MLKLSGSSTVRLIQLYILLEHACAYAGIKRTVRLDSHTILDLGMGKLIIPQGSYASIKPYDFRCKPSRKKRFCYTKQNHLLK